MFVVPPIWAHMHNMTIWTDIVVVRKAVALFACTLEYELTRQNVKLRKAVNINVLTLNLPCKEGPVFILSWMRVQYMTLEKHVTENVNGVPSPFSFFSLYIPLTDDWWAMYVRKQLKNGASCKLIFLKKKLNMQTKLSHSRLGRRKVSCSTY